MDILDKRKNIDSNIDSKKFQGKNTSILKSQGVNIKFKNNRINGH